MVVQVCEGAGKVMTFLDSESHILFPISGSSYERELLTLRTIMNILTYSIVICQIGYTNLATNNTEK